MSHLTGLVQAAREEAETDAEACEGKNYHYYYARFKNSILFSYCRSEKIYFL